MEKVTLERLEKVKLMKSERAIVLVDHVCGPRHCVWAFNQVVLLNLFSKQKTQIKLLTQRETYKGQLARPGEKH